MTHPSLENLLHACERFTDILNQETDLLKSHNIAGANALLIDKQHRADRHQSACALFNTENTMAQCTSEELTMLKDAIDTLHQALIDNKESVDIAYKVRSSIVDKISSAIKDQQAPVCHYTKSAKFSTNSSPVSMLALNRQI